MLRQDRFFTIAAGFEELLGGTAPGHQYGHFVAVVILGNVCGGVEQLPSNAAASRIFDDGDVFEVAERGSYTNRGGSDDAIAVARLEVVPLFVPNHAEAVKCLERFALGAAIERVDRIGPYA